MIINSCSCERGFNTYYLQGFVHALAICCVDTNVCPYFEIYEIENLGDLKSSLFEERKEYIQRESQEYLGAYDVDDLAECHKNQYRELVDITVNKITKETFCQKLKDCFWLTDMKNGEYLLSEFLDCLNRYLNYSSVFDISFYDGNYGGGRFAISNEDKYLIISVVYND